MSKKPALLALVTFSLACALVLSGCVKPAADPKLLMGHDWVVVKFRDANGNMVRPEAAAFTQGRMTLRFVDDHTLAGNGGVDEFGASYTAATDATFDMGAVGRTSAAATDSDLMGQEQELLDDLVSARRYSVSPDSLVLMSGTGATLVRFSPE